MKRLFTVGVSALVALALQTVCIAEESPAKKVTHIDSCRVEYKATDAPEYVPEKGAWWDVEITTVVTNTSDRNIFFKVKSYLHPAGSDKYIAANAKPLKIAAFQTDSVTQILKAAATRFNPEESSYVVKTELFNFDTKETVDTVYTEVGR